MFRSLSDMIHEFPDTLIQCQPVGFLEGCRLVVALDKAAQVALEPVAPSSLDQVVHQTSELRVYEGLGVLYVKLNLVPYTGIEQERRHETALAQ